LRKGEIARILANAAAIRFRDSLMLKRLELVGFKSFADKTTLDFAPGITAIVGPNGSGKSNIVDAVRWILGEQSAKSLRGGEMADVIFNGSTTRRSLGLAEVTVTFDNARHQLSVDAEEVSITRRVYRDGQGEYLINGQPSRLRDIKELFLGSGAGQGAYCIIEQGRVDALLQASHKDRRIIFEEAAGISRFKARKVETLRKLESVDQNLSRSRDLLAELAKQLRSVQLQAAKAQRYQEYSERLRELRLGLGLQEFGELTGHLRTETVELDRLRSELEQVSAEEARVEAEAKRLEANLAQMEDELREQEARLAAERQEIATLETRQNYESTAAEELEAELARGRLRRGELAERIAALAAQVDKALGEWRSSEVQARQVRERSGQLESQLDAADAELKRLRAQVESDRSDHLERMRQTTRLQNDAISLRARLDNQRGRCDGLKARSAVAAEHIASIDHDLEELLQSEAHIQKMLVDARADLGKAEDERDGFRRESEETKQRLGDLRVQRSGLASRIELLDQLESSQEGLGTGVREVLELVRQSRQQITSMLLDAWSASESDANSNESSVDWSFVIGLVADCLTVPREIAPLIDLALGESSQCFLVRDEATLDQALRRRKRPFSGRVGFVPVPQLPSPPPSQGVYRSDEGQRADLLVRCDSPELAGLPARLLGNTRLVADLAEARSIAARPGMERLRFVTRQGELLEAGGMLTVGTHRAEAGILSRKSEMRELRQQAHELDQRIAGAERDLTNLHARTEEMEGSIFFLQQRIADLVEEASEMRVRVSQHRERRSALHEDVASKRSELDDLQQEIHKLEMGLELAQGLAEDSEAAAQSAQARAEETDRSLREQEQARAQTEQKCSEARVELAQVEERLAGQARRRAGLEDDHAERRRELDEFERNEAAIQIRIRDSLIARLQASSELAECAVRKEEAEANVSTMTAELGRRREERRQAVDQLQSTGGLRQEKWNQAHAHEMRAGELRLRLDALCQRIREDYQVELAILQPTETAAALPESAVGDAAVESRDVPVAEGTPTRERLDPEAAQREIDDLRKKLARLGAVNLEALEELAELEKRVMEKQAQHDDLARSQKDLLDVIAKINNDSRKLFTEAFALIRANFQELFRKLFGGGMAEIILEDEADVLECGIEINARPPGKELRGISLLSGGERTLTAIALLLAIFRSKPSPFCLLDEVDAALDEANNARLSGLLRDFLDLSQFIVITHKKRTMAVADVLYGITMQEAGVSRQVSVRFEDWPDDESLEARAAG
jgi:chromosome segregation protein